MPRLAGRRYQNVTPPGHCERIGPHLVYEAVRRPIGGRGVEASEVEPRRRFRPMRIAFLVLVVLFALLLVSPVSPLLFGVLGWFLSPEETGGTSHRVHDVSFGAIFAISLVGVLAQLRSAWHKVAPMQQVAIPIYLLILAEIIVSGPSPDMVPLYLLFGLPPILIALLHPARREVFRPKVRPSPVLLAMVVVAAIPLLVFAVGQFRAGLEGVAIADGPEFAELRSLEEDPNSTEEQFQGAFDEGVAAAQLSPEEVVLVEHFFHWAGMAAVALAIILVGLLAALRIRGWRVTAWTAGLALAYYGLVSVLTSADASSGGYPWGGLAIAWGVVFVFLAEREARAARVITTRPAEA